MAFHQYATTCPDHAGCTAIVCVTDVGLMDGDEELHPAGSVVWVSHDPATTDPAERANPDHPYHGWAPDQDQHELHDRARARGLLVPLTD